MEMLIDEAPNAGFSNLCEIGVWRGPGQEVLDGAPVSVDCC